MTQHTETATPKLTQDEILRQGWPEEALREIYALQAKLDDAVRLAVKMGIDAGLYKQERDTALDHFQRLDLIGVQTQQCANHFKSLTEQLTVQLAQAQNEALFPWKQPALRDWAICGMNHYHMEGVRYLFVSMVKDGRCITAEGANGDDAIWNRLRDQALQSPNSVEGGE